MSIEGRCLCGAVRIHLAHAPGEISACHCTLCTRWGGGVQMGMEVATADAKITGPVKTHRSSRIAERAWCDTCGSALWLRDVDGPFSGILGLSPGLFDNAAGARLTRVVYADRHPDGFWLDGTDVTRVSQQDYEAEYPHLDEENTP